MGPEFMSPHDWSRSYLLPDTVDCTIPRRGSLGMLGAHNYARGLLVEICRYLRATPHALHYRESVPDDGHDVVLDIEAVACLRSGRLLTVHTHTRVRYDADPHVGDWSIDLDGERQPDHDRRSPPSPPMQGWIAQRISAARTANHIG